MPKRNPHRKQRRAQDEERAEQDTSALQRRANERSFANQNIAVTQREQAERRLERAETGRDIWERVKGDQEDVQKLPDASEGTEEGRERA